MIRLAYAVILISSVCTVAAEAARGNDSAREVKAKQIASAWFDSLMRGDTAVTVALSDVPFAWDRKKIIEVIGNLEVQFESIVVGKGKREIKPTEIKVITEHKEIQKNALPVNYIIVHIMFRDEQVVLSVKPGDTFRVVGFSD